ncbi:MAG: glycosyltransferase [Lentisphaeria bacterium]|nr:glycosyltransferase [Lentisphaeria bacterium]
MIYDKQLWDERADSIEEYENKVPHNVLVSVMLQTYNHEKFIEESIESVLEQETNFDFEILIGDDESTDKTREICIKYAKKYPSKIRLFLQKSAYKVIVNDKPTGIFNSYVLRHHARGKFYAQIEGDDCWGDPNKLQIQYDFLSTNKEYSVCFHDAIRVDVNGNFDSSNPEFVGIQEDLSCQDLMKGQRIVVNSFMYHANTERPSEYYQVIAGDFFLSSILGQKGKGKYLGDKIKPLHYRIHEGGIWSMQSKLEQMRMETTTLYKMMHYYSQTEFKENYHYLIKRNIKRTRRYIFTAARSQDLKHFTVAKSYIIRLTKYSSIWPIFFFIIKAYILKYRFMIKSILKELS